jgi:copper chaperone CopZ
VVVLKVSLHCKACAGKVKKHLSKMEGEHRRLMATPSKSLQLFLQSSEKNTDTGNQSYVF